MWVIRYLRLHISRSRESRAKTPRILGSPRHGHSEFKHLESSRYKPQLQSLDPMIWKHLFSSLSSMLQGNSFSSCSKTHPWASNFVILRIFKKSERKMLHILSYLSPAIRALLLRKLDLLKYKFLIIRLLVSRNCNCYYYSIKRFITFSITRGLDSQGRTFCWWC